MIGVNLPRIQRWTDAKSHSNETGLHIDQFQIENFLAQRGENGQSEPKMSDHITQSLPTDMARAREGVVKAKKKRAQSNSR